MYVESVSHHRSLLYIWEKHDGGTDLHCYAKGQDSSIIQVLSVSFVDQEWDQQFPYTVFIFNP
jgi:hypothetical protein